MYNHHLDTFICTAEKGSFAKAAEELYVSHNAVMKQINLLENHLELQLFYRSNHGVVLTEAGELIYHEAKYMVRHSQKTLEQARALLSKEDKIIRVGSSLMRPGHGVVSLWKEVNQIYPEIKLQIIPFDDQKDNYSEIITNLGEKIDIISGLFPSTRFDNRCNTLELGQQKLCCAVSMNHPLASRKSLRIEDLYGEKLIMIHRGDTSYIDALRDEIELNHQEITIIDAPYYDIRTLNLCESTNGIMITAELWKDIHPSLVTVPVEWDYSVPYGILYSRHPSEQVKKFIEAVKKINFEDERDNDKYTLI